MLVCLAAQVDIEEGLPGSPLFDARARGQARRAESLTMVFGSDEAKSIAQKMPIYQQLVQPQITQLVDKAMMTVRTGEAGAVTGTAAPAATPAP